MGRPKTRFGPQRRVTFEMPESDFVNFARVAASQEGAPLPGTYVRNWAMEESKKGVLNENPVTPRINPRRKRLAS